MGIFSKDIKTLDDAFRQTLRTTYYAERQITEALPKMAGMATAPDLAAAFQAHCRETEGQIDRLERVFEMLGEEADSSTCPAIEGIIEAGNAMARDIDDAGVLDAVLASAAQMVEHYEIAQYGTMIAWAKQLGYADCATLLAQTLAEEEATDEKLTRIAETRLNPASTATA
jgi:ferritin-like metal-binding protein YciE